MKIVVGYDGSDGAKRALDRAIALAGDDGQLTVVAASETHSHRHYRGPPSRPVRVRNAGATTSRRSRGSWRSAASAAIAAQGDPGAVILETAKDADLVVVGKRGLNPLRRLVLGSVSSKVISRADRDVLVVP